MMVHVVGDIVTLPSPKTPWISFLPESSSTSVLLPTEIKQVKDLLIADTTKGGLGKILGLGAVESSYMIRSTQGPQSFSDPIRAPLLVLTQYLCCLEGPFWRRIRGKGLSYSYAMRHSPEEGLFTFVLFKSTNLLSAFQEAHSIISKIHETEFDEMFVDSAKAIEIYETISREETPIDAARQSFIGYLRGIPNRKLIDFVSKVNKEELKPVIEQYFTPLFQPNSSATAIVTNSAKTKELAAGFQQHCSSVEEVNLEQ